MEFWLTTTKENIMIEIIAYIMGGIMLGMMSMALVGSNRISNQNQRILELQHEVKTLKQRGRKPQAKTKPVRRRNA
jgi:hypothetical protein|tara:strand:- start:595 stop:822 length:228 start_codon:yes stop_codon:yes gene_type:complete